VPYQIYKAKTVKTAAEGGFEVKRDELDWSAMDATTKAEFEQLFDEPRDHHHRPGGPGTQVHHPRTQPRHRARVPPGAGERLPTPKGVLRKPLLGKAIVFAVTKRHAETLANMFDQSFADKKPSPEVRYADYVVSGMGRRHAWTA
jgi:type I restriction enzyme, R subunit